MGIIKTLDLHQEAQDITAKNDYYLPPYRLTLMTKTADKVVKALVGLGTEITYTEMLIVLETVKHHIEAVLESRRERGVE